MKDRNVIIIGSGPAGLTAAIYAARANLQPLVFEGYQAGGQLMITTEVENYPGYRSGIKGPDLISEFRAQAELFGAQLVTSDITKVDLKTKEKIVWKENKVYKVKTVIIATGATANFLGLKSESKLMGRGVSACATCDGFFFQEKIVCVVGGGDSAMEEAFFLTHYASKVYIIHRRDEFRASKIMIQKALNNPKIEFIMDTTIVEVLGDNVVSGVKLKDKKTGKISDLSVDGMFVAIGHTPNTELFKGQVEMDKKGYIITSNDKSQMSATNIAGVFSCGDVQDPYYRQAITAAASGCIAALDAERYLEKMKRL